MELREGSMETERGREEVERLLKEALEKHLVFDAVIENSDGATPCPNLVVEEIDGENLTLSYFDRDDQLGEAIPVQLSRIKEVRLKEPLPPPLQI